MKTFAFTNVQCVISVTMTMFLLYAAYDIDRHTLEETFKNMHPDLDHLDELEWKECDNLDEKSLERICYEVLSSINITKRILPVDQNWTYIPPPGVHPLHMERVIRRAPVKFHHIMQYTTYMTLIHCLFNESDFYLAQADDKHVFRLEKDPRDDKCYFKSGLHAVNFTLN